MLSKREMITIKRKFDGGYVRPTERGVSFWLDDDKRRNVSVEQLVYEALGDAYDRAYGFDLRGISISIEIQKASRQE
ncbi:MAG: hypothetical protein O3A47_04960 [Chloroflexi bacterium]|nr:hypothetical protein [Chloroflexota bacterium]